MVFKSREAELAQTVQVAGGTAIGYSDFDDFIAHDMDAVILANNFHERALYAIACFFRGSIILLQPRDKKSPTAA